MVEWHLGTIGFTYPEWKGSFYPQGQPSGQALSYYSKIFNAVEVNTTFYGPQSPAQVERWANATPADFCFCMKAPKQATHEQRLQPGADPVMRVFVESSLPLVDKFGPSLIQLPPSFQADQMKMVERFLAALPAGKEFENARYAIEFRHVSWHLPETAGQLEELLRRYGVCWVATDYEDLPVEIHRTAPFLYVRWIGKHNVIPHPGHEIIDRQARLVDWVARIEEQSESLEDVFGFFDNDYAGHAPASCNRLKGLLGLPVTTPPAEEQGRLF